MQCAHTIDSVSIAFWTREEGLLFVSTPKAPFSHLETRSGATRGRRA